MTQASFTIKYQKASTQPHELQTCEMSLMKMFIVMLGAVAKWYCQDRGLKLLGQNTKYMHLLIGILVN